MREFLKKHKIENQFEMLPDVNKKVLLESTWEQDVWSIAKKHGLLIDEIEILVDEIGLVLLGAERVDNLHDHIRSAGLHDDIVNDIIREINAVVFMPMQQKIKDLLAHPKRDALLSEIEDKKDTQPKETVAHKKLSEIFSMAPAKSDYSNEPVKQTGYADGQDPYHEPID